MGFSTAVGIKVFIKEFPHIVGERQNFQVFGVSVKEKVTLVKLSTGSSFEIQKPNKKGWHICERKGDIEKVPTGNAACFKARYKTKFT